nr:PDZ domain-containing protein [Qipengyuania proteolytica]
MVLAALFVAHSPVSAEGPSAQRELYPLEIFQHREDLLFRVGYRLATANAPFCSDTVAASGLLLHDAEAYGEPAAVRALFGLDGDIGVQSVAPASPAYLAGIRQNDTIVSLGGEPITGKWPPTEPRWQRGHALHAAIDTALAKGSLSIGWRSVNEEIATREIQPVRACASRFELIDSSKGASADGKRVLVGENFPGFSYPEDEFAAAVAHEMAHNLLGHLTLFEKTGRKRSLVRLSERDADRLMPWLLANAGYNPSAAIRFMETWGPRHGGGILRKRTHDGWDERVEFIEEELEKIESAERESGSADWQANFHPLLSRRSFK